jgi:dipeptidyl aminopeptidase/acylaminoacyl peptidase
MDDGNASAIAKAAAATVEALIYTHSSDLSSLGTHVAVVHSKMQDEGEVFVLSVYRVADGDLQLIGSGRDPAWSPDGDMLAYLGEDDSGKTQVFVWFPLSGMNRMLFSLPHGVAGSLAWSPNSCQLAFLAVPVPVDRSLPFRVTRTVGWRDGFGLVDDSATQIWVYDVIREDARPLTDDRCVNISPIWLAHTGEIAYVATFLADDWTDMKVVRAVTLDGVVRDIVHTRDVGAIADISPDIGQLVMTVGGQFRDTPGELIVVHHDGSTESRSSELDLDVVGDIVGDLPVPFADLDARILVRGDTAIVRTQNQDRLAIHRLSLRGPQSKQLVDKGEGCLYPLALAGESLLYGSGNAHLPPDLWLRDLSTELTQQVTDMAEANISALEPVKIERTWVTADGGAPVQVKFMRPAKSVGPLPTVLLVHGGPYTAWGEAFNSDAQVLCEAGFGVLLVNPRGSRGYGWEFATAIDGDWGNLDYLDLMAAVDHAVEQGWADPARLGVAGVSYGGFMTAWIVAHTHRFKAAVCENGVTNFVSMYGTSDVGLSYLPEALGGAPHECIDTYMRCSPITTMHTAVTPTLVISGDSDHRCPPEQSLQLYATLKRAGCETELLVLPDSAHVGSIYGSKATRLAQNEGLVEWMLRFL